MFRSTFLRKMQIHVLMIRERKRLFMLYLTGIIQVDIISQNAADVMYMSLYVLLELCVKVTG